MASASASASRNASGRKKAGPKNGSSPGAALSSEVREGPESTRHQLRQLLQVVKAVRRGDFSVRFPVEQDGILTDIGESLNEIIELNESLAQELVRVGNTVGREGKLTERVSIGPVKGAWSQSVDSVNGLIGDLVQPTTEVARVITSV